LKWRKPFTLSKISATNIFWYKQNWHFPRTPIRENHYNEKVQKEKSVLPLNSDPEKVALRRKTVRYKVVFFNLDISKRNSAIENTVTEEA
jgi:hypothetical protein